MKYLVTGCGQSGTTYVANLLTAAGLDCGHEAIFDRWTPQFDLDHGHLDKHLADHLGDSGYIPAPFLGLFDVPIIHLVRPPLDQIRSTVGRRHINAVAPLPWVRFVDHHIGFLRTPAGPRRAAIYWLAWNRLVMPYANMTWKLGQIRPIDIQRLGKMIDQPVTRAEATLALGTTEPANLGPRAEVGLGDLGNLAGAVEELAAELGLPLEADGDG